MAIDDDNALAALVSRIAAAFIARGATLATAESCTGGWIAKLCTDPTGASEWFQAGLVTYSNAAKQTLLGVPEAMLATHGAVSEPVVLAMARGARLRTGADQAVAVSGIAGPGGGSAEKPVGTVWIAWAGPDGERALRYQFQGDRAAIRRATCAAALQGLAAAPG